MTPVVNPNRERECGRCGIAWTVSKGEACPLCEANAKINAQETAIAELQAEMDEAQMAVQAAMKMQQQMGAMLVALAEANSEEPTDSDHETEIPA